jgi:hypothetical protein
MKLLICSFQWYAVTACQYVRTVGGIAHNLNLKLQNGAEYVKDVIPDVLMFRNKVAAHVAGIASNKDDNEAERFASILPQLTFQDDSFYAAGFEVTLYADGKTTSSTKLKPWSLCKVHEQLVKRYWPPEQSSGPTQESAP